MLAFGLFMFGIFFILGLVNGVTPFYSRIGTPFGITVPSAYQKDDYIIALKKEYLYQNIIISTLLALPILFFIFSDDVRQAEMISSVYVTIAMFIYLSLSFLLYLNKRRKIRAWKKENDIKMEPKMEKIIIDTSYQKNLKVISNSVFLTTQLAVVLVTVAITLYYYEAIPERFPIHWNSANVPDRIVDKSYLSVLMLPLMQLLMIPVLFFSHYSFIKSKQKLSPYLSDLSSKQSRLFRKAWSVYFLVVAVLTQLLLSGIHFFSVFFADSGIEWLIGVIIPFVVIIMGYSLYLTWKYGQGGEKIFLHEAGDLPDDIAEADEENYWKWGVWYYNPNDPSVFVEKRFGIGSTMNMARWQAWAFVVGILLFIALMILLSYAIE